MPVDFKCILSISLFGLAGVLLRYFLSLLFNKIIFHPFPFGTFAINILGSFLVGIFYVLSVEKISYSPPLKLGIMIGFLGGFTTFSTFSLESVLLFEKGKIGLALCYFILSPLVGIIFTYGAIIFTRKLI